MLALLAPGFAQAESCPLPANKPVSPGKELDVKGKIVIKPRSSSEFLNFGGNGDTRSFIVVLTTSRPLPGGFTGKQLEMDSPRRPKRIGDTFDSAMLPIPRFSHPQIIEHRRKIRFRVCIDGSNADAGVYIGTIYISGPPWLSTASMKITANLKVRSTEFTLFVAGVLILAFLLLLFKAAKEGKKERKEWKKSLRRTIVDPTFVVSTTVALISALFAMHTLYDQDPAWGTDIWSNLPALGGAAFAAAGVGSVISAFTSNSPPDESSVANTKAPQPPSGSGVQP